MRTKSTVEVTNVSAHGFWLFIESREMFAPFDQFPWFKNATIGTLLNVTLPQPDHLYWPDLDVDLSVDAIEHPEKYPLMSRAAARTVRKSATMKKRRCR